MNQKIMLAWACYWDNDFEWSVLILAPTRGKAKYMFLGEIGEHEFTAVNTQRQPKYDGITTTPMVFMDNKDLPVGCKLFYTEDEI